jgi:hypothetical protein
MPQFPENPRVGDVVHVAPGEEHGVITQIKLNDIDIKDVDGYGEAQTISRIPTSERKFILKNVTFKSDTELEEGTKISVRVVHYPIDSYVFLEDCGWTPKDLGDFIIAFDRIGVVLRKPALTLSAGIAYNIYNEVCVDLPPLDEKEKKDEQP